MKKLICLVVVIAGCVLSSNAQSSGNNSSRNTSAVSNSGKKVNSRSKKKASPSDTLNNRRNYQWKNGQEATPTGQEATSSNGNGFASMKKDTSKPKRKQK